MDTAKKNINFLAPNFMGVRKKWTVIEKDYLSPDLTIKPTTSWTHKDLNSERGTEQFIKLGFDKGDFLKPKPIGLIKRILKLTIDKSESSIVLDFFNGSGTFQHAVFEFNSEEGTSVEFVAIQMPEVIESGTVPFKNGFKVITDITKRRTVLASKGYQKLPDRGFKCFRLVSSNFKSWSNYNGKSDLELEMKLNLFNQEPLNEKWSVNGLLSEIMIMEGFLLPSRFEKQTHYKRNEVVKVSDEYCEHSLIICLDKEIKPETIKSLELSGNDIFICLDSAISNVDKLKLSDKGLIKTI